MKNTVKAIYICILVIVTIIAVGYGIYRNYGLNFKVGKFTFFGKTYAGSGDFVENTIDINSLDSFEKITIDASIGELVIEEGDSPEIYYHYLEERVPEIEVKDGELKIVQKNPSNVNVNNNTNDLLKIVLPKDSHYTKVDISLDLGSITIDDIDADVLDIEAGLGAVETNKCNFDELTIDASLGAVELRKTNIANGDINADLGSVEVDGTLNVLKVNCDLGSIEIKSDNTLNPDNLNLTASLGSISVNGKSYQ